MAINYPTSLDNFTNPQPSDTLDSVAAPHATQHSDLNDAVEALQAKVGADSSAVTTSHDYKIAQIESDISTAQSDISTLQSDVTDPSKLVVPRIHLKKTSNQNITSGSTIYVTWETQEKIDTSHFSHSTSSSADNITFLQSGLYMIIANVVTDNSTSSTRNVPRGSIRVNGTEITSTRTYDYDRGSDYGKYHNLKVVTVMNLTANDIVDVRVQGVYITGTVATEAAECEFISYLIGSST
jgi:hypothetical protein